jgi:predicted transcriptional regulator
MAVADEDRVDVRKWKRRFRDNGDASVSRDFLADYGRDYRYSEVIDREVAEAHLSELQALKDALARRGIGSECITQFEVMAKILSMARGGVPVTSILREARVGITNAMKYIDFLTEAGLMTRRGNSYSTTGKGLSFIFHWNSMLTILRR